MAYSADSRGRLRLTTGDITCLKVDAIVNAANASLLGGGGVDGAIHRAAGPELLAECRKLGDVRRETHGSPARTICRPRMSSIPLARSGKVGRRGTTILENCYRSCIGIARSQGFRDVAFPAIATGIYGFPHELAARIAATTVGSHLAEQQLPELVIFVCFDPATLNAYRNALGYVV